MNEVEYFLYISHIFSNSNMSLTDRKNIYSIQYGNIEFKKFNYKTTYIYNLFLITQSKSFIYLNHSLDKHPCFPKLSKEHNQFHISPITWKIKM